MGLFLVIVSTAAFFGPVTLEKAEDLCAPEAISKECYVEALQPIEAVYKVND